MCLELSIQTASVIQPGSEAATSRSESGSVSISISYLTSPIDYIMYMSDMRCLILEHQTKVREDFTITGKAPTRTSSRLKSASTFTFKTLC